MTSLDRLEALERERDVEPEATCHRCNGPNITWCAPSPLWNAIMRGGDINGAESFAGIVCPICFANLAETAGIASCWRLSAQFVEVPLQEVTPSGRVWNQQTWLWDEPVAATPQDQEQDEA